MRVIGPYREEGGTPQTNGMPPTYFEMRENMAALDKPRPSRRSSTYAGSGEGWK